MQEEGLDTVDANRALGLPDDCREYSSVRNILKDLGIKSIRLMVRCAHAASTRPCERGRADISISSMMHMQLFVSSPFDCLCEQGMLVSVCESHCMCSC